MPHKCGKRGRCSNCSKSTQKKRESGRARAAVRVNIYGYLSCSSAIARFADSLRWEILNCK